MTNAPIEFEVSTRNGIQTMPRMVPWSIAMRSVVIKEIRKIQGAEGQRVLHAFHDDVCLMRKFRITPEDTK